MSSFDPKGLFDVVRAIKGAPLTQADVDAINRAITSTVETGMRISAKGHALINSFESCKLVAYPDPGSKDGTPYTIGWGATGPGIGPGTVWTQAEADARQAADIARFETGVNLLIAGGAPTSQGQFDALVCFAYNVGLDIDDDDLAEGLGDSTLLRKHRAGDYHGARAEFARWNRNDGVVMNGLVRRRAAEAALYAGL